MGSRHQALLLGGGIGFAIVVALALGRPPAGNPVDAGVLEPTGAPPAAGSSPPQLAVADLYRAFRVLGRAQSWGEPVTLGLAEAGELVLPSGRLAASDVFILDGRPLARQVPPGSHPVSLLVARFAEDERVAAAMVRVAAGEPVRWDPAVAEGTDPAAVDADTFSTFGIDSGTAAFAAAEALERLADADESLWQAYTDEVMRQLFPSEDTYRNFARVVLDPATGANVVAFSSGFGDGGYPAWFGLDGAGNPVVLLADFGLLDAQ